MVITHKTISRRPWILAIVAAIAFALFGAGTALAGPAPQQIIDRGNDNSPPQSPVIEVQADNDCGDEQQRICVHWNVPSNPKKHVYTIIAIESKNRSDLTSDNYSKLRKYFHSRVTADKHSTRYHVFNGLKSDTWYRFAVKDHDGRKEWSKLVKTSKNDQSNASGTPHELTPRCVSRFDTNILDINDSQNTVGLAIICANANKLVDNRVYSKIKTVVQSVDGKESYPLLRYSAGDIGFVPMPKIRNGQKYVVQTTAIYNSKKHGTERITSTEVLTYSKNHRACRTCLPQTENADAATDDITIDIMSRWGKVWSQNGETKVTISLSRALKGKETIKLPITVSGGDPGTHWNLQLVEADSPNVSRTASGKLSEVVFSAGGHKAVFLLTGLHSSDQQDRTINIEIASQKRMTIFSHISDDIEFDNTIVNIDIVRSAE